jgi:hypothetical protein
MEWIRHRSNYARILQRGFANGLHGFLWLIKILLPVSLLSFALHATGLLAKTEFLLLPIMGWLHLPANAALPLVMGIFTGTAGTVAAMTALPFTLEQMTLIAIFSLISHNIVQEGIVQAKSGFSFLGSITVRLTASVITVWVISRIFFNVETDAVVSAIHTAPTMPLHDLFLDWLRNTAALMATLFVIIVSMMVGLEAMKTYRLIESLNRMIQPFLRCLGLDPEVGVLWLTIVLFGLAYGGTVIIQEVRENNYAPEKLQQLHISAGINHAVIEEPLLFLPLGIHPAMLWLPRLVVAAVAVHLFRIITTLAIKFSATRS